MRIDYLQEFTVLARYRSFTEAASKLGISQPTLSKHIKALESELNVPLFSRDGVSLALTNAGKLVLPHAFEILEAQQQMLSAAKRGASNLTPRLTISGHVAMKTVLERINLVAQHFIQKYGIDAIDVNDIDTDPTAITELSSANAPDLLFLYIDESVEMGEGIEMQQLARVPLSIVVNENHWLAKKESVTLDDLRNEIFIKLEGDFISGAWHFIEAACLNAGFVPLTHFVYFPRLTDFLKLTFNMKNEVLMLTCDYVNQFSAYISENSKVIPIEDERASMPLAVAYSMRNKNPLIDEALDIILNRSDEMVQLV